MRNFFQAPTIASLAEQVEVLQGGKFSNAITQNWNHKYKSGSFYFLLLNKGFGS